MNENDDSRDPLAEQLRREAMAERPQFSRQLHDRILDRIQDERGITRQTRRFPIAAAAAILLASGLIAYWFVSSKPVSPSNSKVELVEYAYPIPLRMPAFNARVGGIVSAKFWPPEIAVRLPIDQSIVQERSEPSEPPSPLPGSPEWMLATLQQPTLSAKAALTDLVPSEVQFLIDMMRQER